MSSEFASHIGMKGKYFCRVCQAKSDKNNRQPGHAGEIDRLTEFMMAGAPRTKDKTIANLTAQLDRAIDGAPSATDDMATETGSKDKYLQNFLEKLQVAASKLRDEQKERGPGPSEAGISKAEEVKNLLHKLRAEMSNNIFNPVLSISHFDANPDTAVEILHVVLLGVVKYWWRDAVSRQTSKGKEELKARLSSVDVAGLNTPPIRGNTYVQYAGSLVGRDFRVILQVALVVLHGLIPRPQYDGWVALCKLAPLMFQPVIEHMPTSRLNDTIFDFLTATALWNTQWFNKPKFHLFVHIPEHIRHFEPLILYATESFESFNLVIRLRSIHSTKHAPSLDIGSAFSHLHTVRHLISGGYVHSDMNGNCIAPRQAGPEVLALLKDDEFLAFMSMGRLWNVPQSGIHMPIVGSVPSCWGDTTAGKLGITTLLRKGDKVQRCRSIVLLNGDLAEISRMPLCTVQLDQHKMVAFKVLQERKKTDRFENEVTHTVEPNDCFVNLAQLRSATEVQNLCSGVRYPGLSLVEAVEQSIQNWEKLEREAKAAEEAKDLERREKAAEKEAKAVQKELGKRRDNTSKGSSGGTKAKTTGGRQSRKRACEEVDRDYAEGGEELEYRLRPSKSRGGQELGAILHLDFRKSDIRIIVQADFRLPTVMSRKMHNNLIDMTFNSIHPNSQPSHLNLAVNAILPHCLPVPLQLLDDALRGLLVDDDLFAEAGNLGLQHRDAQLVALKWLHDSRDDVVLEFDGVILRLFDPCSFGRGFYLGDGAQYGGCWKYIRQQLGLDFGLRNPALRYSISSRRMPLRKLLEFVLGLPSSRRIDLVSECILVRDLCFWLSVQGLTAHGWHDQRQVSSESPPPLSLGVQRSRSLPQRSTPYNRDHRSRRNENYDPIGPGYPGNFHSQYLPYSGNASSAEYDRTPFSTMQNLDHSSRLPALASLVNVDELSTEYGLSSIRRKAAHAFCKMSSEDRAITIFLRLLRSECQYDEIQDQIQQMQSRLENIAAFCVQSWKPSPEQVTYIMDHTTALRLGLYKDDPTVKAVVNALLVKENGYTRSALRKWVWTSPTEKVSLETFAQKVVDAYHLPVIPAKPPQDIMVSIALMCKVAQPLLKKESQRGGDTGFWRDLEAELEVLYEKNGNQRGSAAWLNDLTPWSADGSKKSSKKDNRKYNSAVGSNARTQQEIDAAVLSGPRARNNVADAGASDDDNYLSTHEDREVHISGLGDLAALATGPVSFEPGMKNRMPLVLLKAVEGTLSWNLRLNYRNPRLNHWNPKRCIFIGIHWTPSGFQ
ncbi:hypothetical protein B0H14DRAFT_3140495 [Mycena olivaceomarginata]|nr:hypothetical protein B0H14DRAFT_3140495 [Mycena olivaceomarginata]